MEKFLKISMVIVTTMIILVGSIIVFAEDEIDLYDYSHIIDEKYTIEYIGYEENKTGYILNVNVINNSKEIISINSPMELSFPYLGDFEEGSYLSEIAIKGYEDDAFEEEKSYGIDPGNSQVIVFNIPKGLGLDEELFDTKNPEISYNFSFYKFRTSPSSLFFSTSSSGGSQFLIEEVVN